MQVTRASSQPVCCHSMLLIRLVKRPELTNDDIDGNLQGKLALACLGLTAGQEARSIPIQPDQVGAGTIHGEVLNLLLCSQPERPCHSSCVGLSWDRCRHRKQQFDSRLGIVRNVFHECQQSILCFFPQIGNNQLSPFLDDGWTDVMPLSGYS